MRKRRDGLQPIRKVVKRITNWGGFLLNPPEECQHKKNLTGGLWVDLGCCQSKTICKNQCERYLSFCKETQYERDLYLVNNNVILPSFKVKDDDENIEVTEDIIEETIEITEEKPKRRRREE